MLDRLALTLLIRLVRFVDLDGDDKFEFVIGGIMES